MTENGFLSTEAKLYDLNNFNNFGKTTLFKEFQ